MKKRSLKNRRQARKETQAKTEKARKQAIKRRRPRKIEPAVSDPPSADRQPIILPDAEGALIVLKGLAELNDQASEAHAKYLDLKERTKVQKEKWEGLAEEVQRKLRLATHGSDLPLFDAVEREADQSAMELAAGQPTEAEAPKPNGSLTSDDPAF
jgi:hypothetical protein